MTFHHSRFLLLTAAALATAGGCSDRSAANPNAMGHGQDEHAHDDGQAHAHSEEGDIDPIVVTHFSKKVQLFMEYPHLVRGEQARFLAHVTVLATGDPIESGQLELELSQPDGTVILVVASNPERDGLFIPVEAFDMAGIYTGRIRVSSPQVEDEFEFGTVVVHRDQRRAMAAANAAAVDEPDDAIPFLLEQQWPIDFLLEPVLARTLVKRLLVPGETVAAGGASAAVSPPVAGRLLHPSSGGLPKIGDQVTAGQVLGFIEPPLPVTEAMQLAANRSWLESLKIELLVRGLDLNARMLEVEQAITQAKTQVEFAQRAFDRIVNLKEQGLRTEAQYDEADRAAKIAQADLSGALELRDSIEFALTELDQIRSVSEPDALYNDTGLHIHLPIRAPIAGTIVQVAHIEGEYVEATDELYRIINAESIWVVAHVPEFDLADLTNAPHADISLPAYPDESFDITELGGRLVNIGIAVERASRTLPIVYELPNPEGQFQIGLMVDVHLGTKTALDVVSIPVSAIIPDSGRSTVYVLLDGENFQRREVVLGIRDGDYIEVKSGVEPGEWVVSHGGNAVRLAALSPASFGHGHAH